MTAIDVQPQPMREGVDIEPLTDKPRTIWRDAWDRIRRSKTVIIATIILILYVLVGVAGFFPPLGDKWSKKSDDPFKPLFDRVIEGADANLPPLHIAPNKISFRPALWFGTDFLGRSVLWRFLYGVRIALTVGVCAAVVEMLIGVVLGAVGGFFGGWIDAIVIWIFSTVASIPWILLMIALAFTLKGRNIWAPWTHDGYIPMAGIPTISLALGLSSWVGLCRLVRAEVLKHRDRDYVIAARAAGVGNTRIIFRHILPNVFHIVIINFSLGLAAYVQAEVVLSFLGLGVNDRPSWGRMIDDAKLELLKGVWWQMAAATFGIFLLSLVVNLFGDALRDALDPRLRGVD